MATNEIELRQLLSNGMEAIASLNPQTAIPETNLTAPATPTDPALQSLDKIMTSQQQLGDVKKQLHEIVDSIAQNPSLITRASNAWGELPMWQKVATGVALTGPTLAVGLFAHIGVLLVLGGVTGVTFTGTAFVLDDHYSCNKLLAQKIEQGLIGLADLLQITINALDKIRQDLANEIQKFKDENFKLAENVSNLGDQVDSLRHQVKLFVATEKMLRETKVGLEKSVKELMAATDKQQDLLEKTQLELKQVTYEYGKSQQQLSEKVAELHALKLSMDAQIEDARVVARTLGTTVNTLSEVVVGEEKNRKTLQDKMATFFADGQAQFKDFTVSTSKVEEELRATKEELREANERYEKLLKKQEILVQRLEKLASLLNPENVNPAFIEGLRRNGLYRDKTNTKGILDDVSLVVANPGAIKVC